MSIYVRDPFREFDALVRRSFGPSYTSPRRMPTETAFVPAVESYRDGEDAVIRLELPGVDVANDVDVEVVGQRLVVSGERRSERTAEEGGRREFRYGSFRRVFRLSPGITAEAVQASYDAGVLTLRVRGAYAVTAGQKIAIDTGAAAAPVAPLAESVEPVASEPAAEEVVEG